MSMLSGIRTAAIMAGLATVAVIVSPGGPVVTGAATPPPVTSWVQTGTTTFPIETALFRTQGVASDGQSLWFSWLNGVSRTDLAGEEVLAARYHDAIPDHLRYTGHNHIGDIDVHDGLLYAPIEDGPQYLSPWIAVYRADTLDWTGRSYQLPRQHLTEGVPWVAIDGPRGVAYTAEWNDTTRLNVHRLSDFEILRTVRLDKTVPRIQGAKVFRGSLYVARDNGAEQSIEAIDPDTGQVTHLFDRNLGDEYEAEGIAFVRGPTGTVMLTTDIFQGSPMSVQMRTYRINGDTEPPVLTNLGLTPSRVRPGKRAAPITVRVRASERASARVRWRLCTGRGGRCDRSVPRDMGREVQLRPGANSFQVRTKVRSAKGKATRMRPGKWLLTLVAVDQADVTGMPARARLTVVKPKRRHR
ncbi:MAG: hypothetical protein M3Y45_00920 [Actinomycetota bacterium]|nr:hypothetical protein [Actinomycetota bacterium]